MVDLGLKTSSKMQLWCCLELSTGKEILVNSDKLDEVNIIAAILRAHLYISKGKRVAGLNAAYVGESLRNSLQIMD